VSEPIKVKNLLLDFVPELMNEVKAFSNVLCDADINRYICEHKDIQESYIITRIENNMGLSSEWARYITKGLVILVNNSELSVSTTQYTDKATENRTTEVTTKCTVAPITQYQNTPSQEQKFLNSGFSRLSAGLWQLADEDFDKALEISSNPRAYVGKMMVALQIKKEKDIIKSEHDIEKNPFWILATEHATGSYKHKLQNYAREHRRYIDSVTVDEQQRHPVRRKKRRKTRYFDGGILFACGLIVLIGSIAFGLYAWFADTGLNTLTYYLILTGTCAVGAFVTFLFSDTVRKSIDSSDLFAAFVCMIISTICVVGGVSLIGIIGDQIIKLVH